WRRSSRPETEAHDDTNRKMARTVVGGSGLGLYQAPRGRTNRSIRRRHAPRFHVGPPGLGESRFRHRQSCVHRRVPALVSGSRGQDTLGRLRQPQGPVESARCRDHSSIREAQMIGKLSSVMSRVLFLVAFLLAGLAVWEKLLNAFGFTMLRGYAPSRLLEYAAVAVLFVIALQLREMKELQKPRL